MGVQPPKVIAMGEIRDFTKQRPTIQFKIDGDVFTASPAIPAQVMIDFAKMFAGMDPDKTSVEDQLQAFSMVLKIVLTPPSLTVFQRRMADPTTPVDMEQIENVIEWLFEEYGMRPTQPVESSPPGPPDPDSGMSSTGSTPVVVSTSQL